MIVVFLFALSFTLFCEIDFDALERGQTIELVRYSI